MGEYADEQIIRDMQRMFGIDYEGSGQGKKKPQKPKVKCEVCGRRLSPIGINDHMRDYHKRSIGLKGNDE